MANTITKKNPRGAGRTKGIPNKVTLVVREYLEYKHYNIVEELITTIGQVTDPAAKADLLLKLMPYCHPKYKDVEHTLPPVIDSTAMTISSSTDNELLDRLDNQDG